MTRSELHQAAKEGDLQRVSELLRAPRAEIDVNKRDRKGWTPLMYAVSDLDVDIELVRTLLHHGAGIDQDNILRLAIGTGDPQKVAALIEAGADIRYRDEHGYDALIDAAYGRDALHNPRFIELLKLLIANGVSLAGMSTYGESAVRVLSHLGRFDAVQFLLQAGANVNDLKLTPLIEAVAFGSLADIEAVIESGIDLEERDYWDRTAWLIALQMGDIPKARLLLEHGSDRDARGRCGKPPLFYAIENHHVPMLKWLLEIGATIQDTDDGGDTALITGAVSGNEESVAILLKSGADVNQKTELGTALSHAGTRTIALQLMKAGADPQELPFRIQRELMGYPADRDADLLNVSPDEFLKGRSPCFGTQNPEKMHRPFWEGMIRSGIDAYHAGELFGENHPQYHEDYTPIWCAQRFGQSMTFLPDGRIVQVAGEHEDYYDPDFYIYNDVIVHDSDGNTSIYGYPRDVFPPTDFHTATLIGNYIYLIGSLGYLGKREYGETPVYRLDIDTFHMERLETTGNKPGWIYKHRAMQSGLHEIEVMGGTILTLSDDDKVIFSENATVFILDLDQRAWRVSLST